MLPRLRLFCAVLSLGLISASLAATDYSAPRATYQRPPIYPDGLRRQGIEGYAIVDFDVDPNGQTTNAKVLEATDRAFGLAALAALAEWKFKPAQENGLPVKAKITVPFEFSLNDDDAVHEAVQKAMAKRVRSPAEVPPFPVAAIKPVYPFELREQGITGSATVDVTISQGGHVSAVKVIHATRPEFGYATIATLENMQLWGAPQTTFTVQFDQETMPNKVGTRLMAALKKDPTAIPLDPSLKNTAAPLPRFPITATTATGEAVIEAFVLKNGRTDLPRIVSASSFPFGYAAAEIVKAWRFEPPKLSDKAVAAKVQIAFSFNRSGATTAHLVSPSVTANSR